MPERTPPPIDFTDLDRVTDEEREARLVYLWRNRRPLYNVYAEALMLDYAPDYWKRARWYGQTAGRPIRTHSNAAWTSQPAS